MSDTTTRSKVLVIDDELGPRESLRFLFKDKYDVVCADSVDDGVASMRDDPPDVIIMDIKMPGKTGIEGLREIRALDSLVSVIMLTGFGNLETAQKAIRLGANDYIKKPFDTREMRDTVKRYIEHTQLSRKKERTVQDLEKLNKALIVDIAQKQHLASLGEASSEFVHDLRNPLTVISGYVQLLTQEISEIEVAFNGKAQAAIEYMELIDRTVSRCHEMAEGWRTFARGGTVEPKELTVASIMHDVHHNSLAMSPGPHVRIELLSGPSDLRVNIDIVQFMRAMNNITANSIEALPPRGGMVALGWQRNEDRVEIFIEDNGSGIPPEIADRIFEPRFTTKAGQGGSGLGLHITKRTIEMHRGTITISNKKEGGTVARISLPLVQSA